MDGLVRTASANLESFDVVGDTGRMDAFREEVGRVLGVRLLKLARNQRPSGGRPEFLDEQMRRVRDICAPDLEIYENAMSRKLSC